MKLYMRQKVFSWVDRFTIRDEQEQDLFSVQGEFHIFARKLHVYTPDGAEAALIRQQFPSLFPSFLVKPSDREAFEIASRFALLRHRLELIGLPGYEVRGDFFDHDYTMYDGEREAMRLSRHWFTWGDSYELDIDRNEDVLTGVCVALAVDAILAMSRN